MNRRLQKKYLHVTRKRFDPISLIISAFSLVAVIALSIGVTDRHSFLDARSLFVVFVGTFASVIFQYDFLSVLDSFRLIASSFLGTPDKKVRKIIQQLDEAILNDKRIEELREGQEITGELLNDIVYMSRQGLLVEEIEEFLTARIQDEFFARETAMNIMQRASINAPAFGLFGTVIGLVSVLKSLSNPALIGPAMALALMTTAYGSALGTIICGPLAGRLEHHNETFLEVHKQLMNKVSILMRRDDRRLDVQKNVEVAAA